MGANVVGIFIPLKEEILNRRNPKEKVIAQQEGVDGDEDGKTSWQQNVGDWHPFSNPRRVGVRRQTERTFSCKS